MSLKIYRMGRRIDGKYDSFKSWCGRVWRMTKLISYVGAFGLVVGFLAVQFFPEYVYSVQEVKVKDNTPSAVLQRIATCESRTGHLDKNGQVAINKTQDIGKYQINVPIWGKKATELGLNLAVEKDNEAMALWLYENHGTEPWVHSKSCWNK